MKRLPPGHPKAKITEAASHVREMIQNQIHMEPDQDDLEDDSEDDEEEDEHAMDLDSDMVIILLVKINVVIAQLVILILEPSFYIALFVDLCFSPIYTSSCLLQS